MVKILSYGDGKHRIENDHDGRIGWINGATIGFRGFATESDAREAAIAGRRALDRALRGHFPGWPGADVALERVHIVNDGAYDWFYDGKIAVARLLRPHRRAYDASFGIELVLPSFSNEGVAIAAAYAVSIAVEPYRDVMPALDDHVREERAVPAGELDTSTFY